MSKPDVKTVAKAQRLSLIKWKKVHTQFIELFIEIDKSCGFCDLGRHRAGARDKCDHCGVKTRCEVIIEVVSVIENDLEKVIDGTLSFLENMDVKEK